MITIHDLLRDKTYKSWFLQQPSLPEHMSNGRLWWRVYVQREVDGTWGKKDFHTYTEAFKFLKLWLPRCHDATIHCRGYSYDPPSWRVRVVRNGQPVMVADNKGKLHQKTKVVVWRPKLVVGDQPHTWCMYCRRPVELRWFSSHHAFKTPAQFDHSLRRCPICGSSERLLNGRGY